MPLFYEWNKPVFTHFSSGMSSEAFRGQLFLVHIYILCVEVVLLLSVLYRVYFKSAFYTGDFLKLFLRKMKDHKCDWVHNWFSNY